MHLFFSIKHYDNAFRKLLTTALQCIKTQNPHTLAGFEPGIFKKVFCFSLAYYRKPRKICFRVENLYPGGMF
jgi:hypothetical protein